MSVMGCPRLLRPNSAEWFLFPGSTPGLHPNNPQQAKETVIMTQSTLPYQKPQPVCLFCATPKGQTSEVTVKFIHLEDSRKNHYAMVVLPTCKAHQHLPLIHDREPGVKP
jgi:hypothetical protein